MYISRIPEIVALIEKKNIDAINEIGTVAKADLMLNCPVDTGTLRRGHAYKLDGTRRVVLGVYPYYGKYVEFKPRGQGGNPWFRRTLQADREKFKAIIRKHLGGIK